jgi:hypothetical protein
MKKVISSLVIATVTIILFNSCSDDSDKKTDDNKTPAKNISSAPKTIEQMPIEQPETLEPAEVTVKLFFKNRDLSGYEGYEDEEGYTPKISERENFRIEHKYTFCYDSEIFDNLQFIGNGDALNLQILQGKEVIFRKNNFELKGILKLTEKDFDLSTNPTSVILTQNDKIIFQGNIDAQPCM